MVSEESEEAVAKIIVDKKDFRISGVTCGDLLSAMREVGTADDVPNVATWSDMIACALRRRGLTVQLTVLSVE